MWVGVWGMATRSLPDSRRSQVGVWYLWGGPGACIIFSNIASTPSLLPCTPHPPTPLPAQYHASESISHFCFPFAHLVHIRTFLLLYLLLMPFIFVPLLDWCAPHPTLPHTHARCVGMQSGLVVASTTNMSHA